MPYTKDHHATDLQRTYPPAYQTHEKHPHEPDLPFLNTAMLLQVAEIWEADWTTLLNGAGFANEIMWWNFTRIEGQSSTICWWTDEIKIYSSGALLVFQQGLSMVWCNSAADGLEESSNVPPAGIIHWNSTGLAGGSEAAAQGVGWWSFNWLGGESTVTADGVMRWCFRGRGHKITEVSLSGKLSWTSSDVTAISEAVILAFASRASGR